MGARGRRLPSVDQPLGLRNCARATSRGVDQALARHGHRRPTSWCARSQVSRDGDTETTRRLFADLAAPGREGLDRRLRHRLLQPGQAAQAARTRAEDRPRVRRRPRHQRRRARAVVETIDAPGTRSACASSPKGWRRRRSARCGSLGCDELQGHLFAKPMPPQALLAAMLPDPAAEGRWTSPSVLMEAGARGLKRRGPQQYTRSRSA